MGGLPCKAGERSEREFAGYRVAGPIMIDQRLRRKLLPGIVILAHPPVNSPILGKCDYVSDFSTYDRLSSPIGFES